MALLILPMRAIAFHVSFRPICTRPIYIFLVGIQLHLTYDIVSRKLISLALACFNHLHFVSALQNSIDKVRFQLQLNSRVANAYILPSQP